MVFEDLYKKDMFFKDDMFLFQKKRCFFLKKLGKENTCFFVVDKTKQKILFENYKCFSKKEKKSGAYFC